jgi:hypothetical protein
LLAREGQELRHLAERLAACARWQRELQAGREPPGAPYLLGEDTEAELQRAMSQAPTPCPPIVGWLARVVCWLAGTHAAQRFVHAIAPHLAALSNPEDDRRLSQFMERLQVWRTRSLWEPFRPLQAELKQAIAELRPQLVQAGGLTARLRGRSFAEHCDHLLATCQTLAGQQCDLTGSRLPAVLAAWAACDGGTAPLPQRLIAPALAPGGVPPLERAANAILKESMEPGYDALLVALDCLDPSPDPHTYGHVRMLSARGASLDDLAWCETNGMLGWLSSRQVQPSRLRSVMGELERRGVALNAAEWYPLADLLAVPQGQKLLSRWLRWLDQPLSRTGMRRLRHRIKRALMRTLHWAVRQPAYVECLNAWFQPPVNAAIENLPADLADAALRPIQWLAAYQRLAGRPFTLPQSMRKLLDERSAVGRECAYLRQRVIAGEASSAMHKRWQSLEMRLQRGGGPARDKLPRAAEEALVVTAVQTLPVLIRAAAEAKWRDIAGVAALDVPLERLLNLVDWATCLGDEQRSLLRSLLETWQQHGLQYKRHLPGNRAWLAEATDPGWDVATWLTPPPECCRIGEWEVQIGSSLDPREVFHMGDFFRTCLSLGSCQQASVLANAHDANKHVVLLTERGPQRRVLGRQLVAISGEGALIGYHCFVGIDNKLTELRARALELMAQYCGRLARQCGLPLADEGKPKVLSPVDWWDDGVWAWHAAARQAWALNPGPERTEPFACERHITLNGLENAPPNPLLQLQYLTAAAGPETSAWRSGQGA